MSLAAARVGGRLDHRACCATEEVAGISGHSLRVDAAQQLTINGHGLPQVMRAGGWSSVTTVARYIENAEMALWALWGVIERSPVGRGYPGLGEIRRDWAEPVEEC